MKAKKDTFNSVVPQRTVFKIRYISKEVCRILPFVSTKAVLVRKIDKHILSFCYCFFVMKPPFHRCGESVAKPIIVLVLPSAKSLCNVGFFFVKNPLRSSG